MQPVPESTPPLEESPIQAKNPTRSDSSPRYGLHLLLFLLALITCTLAGAELVTNRNLLASLLGGDTPEMQRLQLQWADLHRGLPYALAFLGFLTVHELGHYFMARRLGVPASLPYYLPIFLPGLLNIGSLGAVIRLRGVPGSRRKMFAIGVAGPLAGAVVAVGLLVLGFTHLPAPEYLYAIHPEYLDDFGRLPTDSETVQQYAAPAQGQTDEHNQGPLLAVGSSLLFELLKLLADPQQLPNRFELIHYPFLWAGYLGLFFTALNLLPIGQLDGGHIVYGLFGARVARRVSRLTVMGLLFYGGIGLARPGEPYWNLYLGLYLLLLAWLAPSLLGTRRWQSVLLFLTLFVGAQQALQLFFPGDASRLWLLWGVLGVRFIGLDHPRAPREAPLTRRERYLGYLAIVLFLLCFTPEPLYFVYSQLPSGSLLTLTPLP